MNSFQYVFCEWFSRMVEMQMRHLYVVIDGSRTMEDQDLKPNRLTCTLKVFLHSFFSFLSHHFSINWLHFAFQRIAVSCICIASDLSSLHLTPCFCLSCFFNSKKLSCFLNSKICGALVSLHMYFCRVKTLCTGIIWEDRSGNYVEIKCCPK